MLLGKILLVLILFYEVYRVISLKDFIRTIELMDEVKKAEKGSPELAILGMEVLNNKQYIFIIIAEILYLLFTVILLFTPYVLVSLLLVIQALIIKFIQKKDGNRKVLQADSIISIVIILLGFILV